MHDAFQQLISFWRRAGLADEPELIADALWLASHLPPPPKSTEVVTGTDAPHRQTEPAPEPVVTKPDQPAKPLPAPESKAATEGGLFQQPGDKAVEKTIPASAVTVAAASALPNPLVLSRALRPFSKRFASRNRTEFDEEETAEQTAKNRRRPTPRYRPLPERWFDIALVVEDTPSMAIWRRSVQEFRLLLERQGSFRDVRTWRLQPGGQLLDRHTVRRPAAISDATGRRLILIVSDCVSADWYNGMVASLALRWGRQTPVAIIQVLPARAWPHTALGEPSSMLRSPRAGLPTSNLVADQGWWTPDPTGPSITVPVIPLDAEDVHLWARMSMGMGGATYPGVVLEAKPPQTPFPVDQRQDTRTARMMVDAYESMVSREAFELARYLAAAPLSLPVMRLVQQTMFGERARQFHLAEFFLGGLIRKVADAADPEDAGYEFHEGVRTILLEGLQRSDAFDVIRKVSRFVESRIGQPLDWKALVPDAAGTLQLPDAALPFAKVAREVLGRMGVRQPGGPVATTQAVPPAAKAQIAKVLTGHTGPVTSVMVVRLDDRALIVSASNDRTVRVWDLLDGTLRWTVSGPLHPLLAEAANGSSPEKVYVVGEGVVRAVNIRTGETQDTADRVTILGDRGNLRHLGTEYLVTGSPDGRLQVWDVKTRELTAPPIPAHEGAIHSVAVYNAVGAGWVAVSGGEDATVRITDLRSALLKPRNILLWDIGAKSSALGELAQFLFNGLSAAGHQLILWDNKLAAAERLPSIDHVVAVMGQKLESGVFNPYDRAIECRPFFLALGPEADTPTYLTNAVTFDFRDTGARPATLERFLDAIESTAPTRVGRSHDLLRFISPIFRRREVEQRLKSILLDPAGPKVLYLTGEGRECYARASIVADDCEVRRRFTGGIYSASQAYPSLNPNLGEALLIVTRGSLIAGAVESPLPNTRVLVTNSDYSPDNASSFQIPPVSADETTAYMDQRGLLKLSPLGLSPQTFAAQVTAMHKGSGHLLELIVRALSFAAPNLAAPWAVLLSSADPEDDLIALSIQTLDPNARRAAEELTVFREGDWVPRQLMTFFSPAYEPMLSDAGILERSADFEFRRLQASARKRLSPASPAIHAAVVARYRLSGPFQQVPPDGYFDGNIEYHLYCANMSNEAVSLLSDLPWLSRKLKNLWIRRVLADLSELHDVLSLEHLNSVLGASATLLERSPDELPAALLRYAAEPSEPLSRLQAFALTQLSPAYRAPTFFVLVSGTGVGTISESVAAVSEKLGREIARNGFGLVTGGWPGVDEITARAYLAERYRLGFADSMAALIQVAGTASSKILTEGAVVQPANDEQDEAVRRANAVVLIEGVGGVLRTFRHAREQGKPVFPIAGSGGDALRAFQELIKADMLWSGDPIGGAINTPETQDTAIRAVMSKVFLASRATLPVRFTGLALAALAQEYLDIRATETSGSSRTEHMTELMRKMQSFAVGLSIEDALQLLKDVNRGYRLAGIARAFVQPDARFLEPLTHALMRSEDTPFGQFWCLQAIEKTLRNPYVRHMFEGIRKQLEALQPRMKPGSDRARMLTNLLSEFGHPATPA